MGGISLGKLLVVAVVIALLFGTKRLRSLGDDLGHAIKGFKNSLNSEDKDNSTALTHEDHSQKS